MKTRVAVLIAFAGFALTYFILITHRQTGPNTESITHSKQREYGQVQTPWISKNNRSEIKDTLAQTALNHEQQSRSIEQPPPRETQPPFQNATILDERMLTTKSGNRLKRERHIHAPEFKYPNLHLTQWLDPDTKEVSQEIARVCDHVIITLKPDGDLADLKESIEPIGLSVRREMFTPGHYLVAATEPSLDAATNIIAQLEGVNVVNSVSYDSVSTLHIHRSNDPRLQELWGLHNSWLNTGRPDSDIDAPEAWAISLGSRDVVVAVLDGGLDIEHPDIAANVFKNPGETGGGKENNGIDDDNNGLVDDVNGWDFYLSAGSMTDPSGHGTHVSGTIGALQNNNAGISGVSPLVSIMPLRWIGDGGSGVDSDAIDALHYAMLMDVDLTNNSWGSLFRNELLRAKIEEHHDAGILFVAAAGNDANDNDTYDPDEGIFADFPASYDLPNIISVSASNALDELAEFSSFGATTVDLAAPGVDILSLNPTAIAIEPSNPYESLSGTSMAAPHVSGALALLRSMSPDLSAAELKSILLGSVDKVPELTGKCSTGGRLNLAKMLRLQDGAAPLIESLSFNDRTLGNGNGFLEPGESFALDWTIKNIGDQDLTNLSFRIEGVSDNFISHNSSAWELASLGAGDGIDANGQLQVSISSMAPPPPEMGTIDIVLQSGSDSWRSRIQFPVFAVSSISGAVTRTKTGLPLANATVYARREISTVDDEEGLPWLQEFETTTDEDGNYSLTLPLGDWEILAHADGVNASAPVAVELQSSPKTQNIAMGAPSLDADQIPDRIDVVYVNESPNTELNSVLNIRNTDTADATLSYELSVTGNLYDVLDSESDAGTTYNWVELKGDVDLDENITFGGAAWLDGPYELPFEIPFFGEPVREFVIGANGGIVFFHEGISDQERNDLAFGVLGSNLAPYPDADQPGNLLGILLSEYEEGHEAYMKQLDTDRFAIQWQDANKLEQGEGQVNTFQVIVHRDGSFHCQYKELNLWNNLAMVNQYSVGLHDLTATAGAQFEFDPEEGEELLQENMAVAFKPWYQTDHPRGSLNVNQSQAVALDIDASNIEKNRELELILTTNDPLYPRFVIPLTVHLQEEESAGGYVGFHLDESTIREDQATASISLTRFGGSTGAASARLSINSELSSASPGDDFSTPNGLLIEWADGESGTKEFQIDITEDLLNEGNERIHFSITSLSNASASNQPTHTLTIIDNDTSAAPANDSWANARLIEAEHLSISGSTAGASFETDEPMHAGRLTSQSIWYKWIAPSSGLARVNAPGSDDALILSIYRGASLGTIQEVASDWRVDGAPARAEFHVVSGQTYYIAIASEISNSVGASFDLEFSLIESANKMRFAQSRYDVMEDAGTLEVRLLREGDTTEAAQINYSIHELLDIGSDGIASVTSETILFATGQDEATLTIDIEDNELFDSDRIWKVSIDRTGGAEIGMPSQTSIRVIDNESSLDWADFAQGTHTDEESNSRGNRIAHGKDGSVYIVGDFSKDLQTGSTSLESNGREDLFLVKLSRDLKFLWGTSIGSTADDHAASLAVSPDGKYVAVGGRIGGSITLPEETVLSPAGPSDACLVVWTADGSFHWGTNLGSDAADTPLQDLVFQDDTSLYAVGDSTKSFQLSPSVSVAVDGSSSAYIVGYNLATKTAFDARSIAGLGSTSGRAIALADTGEIYISGGFTGEFFHGGSSMFGDSKEDGFIASWNSAGNAGWATRFGGTKTDLGLHLKLAANGDLLAGGTFETSAIFDSTEIQANGGIDAFVARYQSSDGSVLWARAFGSSYNDTLVGIAEDRRQRIIASGSFYESFQFGSALLTSGEFTQAYVLALDANGTETWIDAAQLPHGLSVEHLRYDKENARWLLTGAFSGIGYLDRHFVSSEGSEGFFAGSLVESYSSYDEWADMSFADSTSNDAAKSANPDGDTLHNFMEYSLGTHPLIADNYWKIDADRTSIQFRRREGTSDTAAKLERSSSLQSWTEESISDLAIETSAGGIKLLQAPMNSKSAGEGNFWRMSVQELDKSE